MHYHGPQGIVLKGAGRPYHYAWNWILPNHPFDSPTYYRVDINVTKSGGVTKHYSPIWYISQANLPLWYGFWIAMAGLLYAISIRKEFETAVFIMTGIILNYTPWLVISMLVHRTGFNYYMIYTLPFIALGIGFTWKLLPKRIGTTLLLVNLLLALIFFLWFFPIRPIG
jgi:hypothetical protein